MPLLDLSEFRWTERSGTFDEWTFEHVSGRILAAVSGPQDKRGGFTHNVSFLFSQKVTMRAAPYVFVDFDSAKCFVEFQVQKNLASINEVGSLQIETPPPPDLGLGPLME
jgi:hypothetical protein